MPYFFFIEMESNVETNRELLKYIYSRYTFTPSDAALLFSPIAELICLVKNQTKLNRSVDVTHTLGSDVPWTRQTAETFTFDLDLIIIIFFRQICDRV